MSDDDTAYDRIERAVSDMLGCFAIVLIVAFGAGGYALWRLLRGG